MPLIYIDDFKRCARLACWLSGWNRTGRSNTQIRRIARELLINGVIWAENARGNKSVDVKVEENNGHLFRIKVKISRHRATRSIKYDLERMRDALIHGDKRAFAISWANASAAAQRRALSGRAPTLELILNRSTMMELVDVALSSKDLRGRPREYEWDRCVNHLVNVYEHLTGKKPTISTDPETGLPNSEVHRFLLEASRLTGYPFVTETSDGRMKRAIKRTRASRP